MSTGWRCCGCGSSRVAPVGRNQDFPSSGVVRCRACGLMATQPAPDRQALARFYSGPYSERRGFRDLRKFDVRADAQLRCMLRHVEGGDVERPFEGREALDIGCGPGSLLRCFERCGARVHGYDADPTAIEVARGRLNAGARLHAELFDVEADPERRYDVVAMSHLLEHVPDPRRFVEGLLGVMRPGGVLFIEVPNNDAQRVKKLIHRARKGTGHLNFFEGRSLAGLVERAGGSVRAVETAGPDKRLHDVAYGTPDSAARRLMLRAERRLLRLASRFGRRAAPKLRWSPDWSDMEPPDGAEGVYLRLVATVDGLAAPGAREARRPVERGSTRVG